MKSSWMGGMKISEVKKKEGGRGRKEGGQTGMDCRREGRKEG